MYDALTAGAMDKLMDKGVGQQVRACAACLRAQSARVRRANSAHFGRSLQTLSLCYFRTARPMPACLPASHAANRLLQQIRSHAAHAARRGAFHVDRKGAGPAICLPSDAWCLPVLCARDGRRTECNMRCMRMLRAHALGCMLDECDIRRRRL